MNEQARVGRENAPAAIVVMGVSGCGKSTVGKPAAKALSWLFVEGDDFHPPENVARMKAGKPLDDEHRWGWLDALGAHLASLGREGKDAIAACSALKRKYRERLLVQRPDILFIYLEIDRETAHRRVGGRKGHFMPESLVESQFAALEPPQKDEPAITLDGTRSIAELTREVVGIAQDMGKP